MGNGYCAWGLRTKGKKLCAWCPVLVRAAVEADRSYEPERQLHTLKQRVRRDILPDLLYLLPIDLPQTGPEAKGSQRNQMQ